MGDEIGISMREGEFIRVVSVCRGLPLKCLLPLF